MPRPSTALSGRTSVFRRLAAVIARVRRWLNGGPPPRHLFAHAPDALFAADVNGRLTALNPAGERLLGRPRRDVLGHTWADFAAGPCEWAVRDLSVGRDRATYELTLRTPAGRPGAVLEISTRTVVASGQVTGVVGVARDISDRRRAEADARQAARLEAAGRLAAGGR
jgi:PAS domain S-box-containing protein